MDAEVFMWGAIYLRINHKKIQSESTRMIDAVFISAFYRFGGIIHLAKMSFLLLIIIRRGKKREKNQTDHA